VNFLGFYPFHSSNGSSLSNFSPCYIHIFGQRFLSAEQTYQWAKAIMADDHAVSAQIMRSKLPAEAKSLVNSLTISAAKWQSVSDLVMRNILFANPIANPTFDPIQRYDVDGALLRRSPKQIVKLFRSGITRIHNHFPSLDMFLLDILPRFCDSVPSVSVSRIQMGVVDFNSLLTQLSLSTPHIHRCVYFDQFDQSKFAVDRLHLNSAGISLLHHCVLSIIRQ